MYNICSLLLQRFFVCVTFSMLLSGCWSGSDADRTYPVGADPDVIDVPSIPLKKGMVQYLFEGGRSQGPYAGLIYPMVHMAFPLKSFFDVGADKTISRTYGTNFLMYYHTNPSRLTGSADKENADCLEDIKTEKVINGEHVTEYDRCHNELLMSLNFDYFPPGTKLYRDYTAIRDDLRAGYLIKTTKTSAYPDFDLVAISTNRDREYPEEVYVVKDYMSFGKRREDTWTLTCDPVSNPKVNPRCNMMFIVGDDNLMHITLYFSAHLLPVAKDMLMELHQFMEKSLVRTYRLKMKKQIQFNGE